MSLLEAIILGFIQGLTEFLPVSSSGHLELGQYLFGMRNLNHFILFNLVCHLGTLFAVFIFFRQQIVDALFQNKKRFFQIVLGTLPLFPLLLIMKPIKSLFDKPEYLGFFFLITALLLYVGIRFGRVVSQETLQKRKWRDALVIGCFQAVAILPGVSRSGATISAGKLLGWSQQECVTFSFLLAIPAILGGSILEFLKFLGNANEISPVSVIEYFAGFVTSFVMGFFALRLLMKLVTTNKLKYFVWYCLFMGIVTLVYFNL